jgi:hypothetical protein
MNNTADHITKYTTREDWLAAVGTHINDALRMMGFDVPAYRVSCGFPVGTRPYTGRKSHKSGAIGQAWDKAVTDDGIGVIFISPVLSNPLGVPEDGEPGVIDVLAHEIAHHVAGLWAGHGKHFRKVMRALDLAGKPTATYAGPVFAEFAEWVLEQVGPYPHAAMDVTRRAKQGTRLIKVMCQFPCTDMSSNMTRKWLDAGLAPLCPECGEPMVEVARDPK